MLDRLDDGRTLDGEDDGAPGEAAMDDEGLLDDEEDGCTTGGATEADGLEDRLLDEEDGEGEAIGLIGAAGEELDNLLELGLGEGPGETVGEMGDERSELEDADERTEELLAGGTGPDAPSIWKSSNWLLLGVLFSSPCFVAVENDESVQVYAVMPLMLTVISDPDSTT